MNKHNSGFTIVEAIVVATIVAILAAVAVPNYINYVNSTRQDAVDNLAQTAAAAADIYFRKTGDDPDLADLNMRYDNTKYTVTVTPPNVIVASIEYPAYTSTVAYK